MLFLFLRAAISAASLQTLAISAPAKPGVCADSFLASTSVPSVSGFVSETPFGRIVHDWAHSETTVLMYS